MPSIVPVVDALDSGVANVAELVDALDLGSSGATRESSSLSFRTSPGSAQHRRQGPERSIAFPSRRSEEMRDPDAPRRGSRSGIRIRDRFAGPESANLGGRFSDSPQQ